MQTMTMFVDFSWLLRVVAKVKNCRIGIILLNKQESGDGKYSKLSSNCARFELNRILK